MAGTLLPAEQALERYFPDAASIEAMPGGVDPGHAKVLVIEGDLVIDRAGLIQTVELMPEVTAALGEDETLVAIVVTGNLTAPDLVLLEPDIDWSPRFRVAGNMQVKSLCLGGSVSLVEGDLTVSDTLFGYYNHGWLKVSGRTRATTILASDYEFDFGGKVTADYVLSHHARMNIPAAYEREQFHLVLEAEVIDDENCVKDGEVIRWLEQGKSILRPKEAIGTQPEPAVSSLAKERIAAIVARAEAGETITEIDLTASELRFVPEEIRQFKALRALHLSKNEIRTLPDWIGAFAELTVLEAEDCGLTAIPDSVAHLPTLQRLDIARNDVNTLPLRRSALPFARRSFPALEHLRIGGAYNSDANLNFIANFDLAPFPALRYAELEYANLPEVSYSARADQWNAPKLEFLRLDGKIAGGLPAGLFKAKRLKGLAIGLMPDAIRSAHALKQQLPDLEVLSLGYGAISGPEVQALAAALHGVHTRVEHCPDFALDPDHPLQQLSNRVGLATHKDGIAEAVTLAAQLVAQLDLGEPRYEADFIEGALFNCMDAFLLDAFWAEGAERAEKAMLAGALADRILAFLPKTGALCWLLHQRDLGLLRLACVLAQANRHLHRPTRDVAAATALLDAAQAEVDAFMDQTNAWFMQRAGWIGTVRDWVAFYSK